MTFFALSLFSFTFHYSSDERKLATLLTLTCEAIHKKKLHLIYYNNIVITF